MLSDQELRSQLQDLGLNPGPITAATRSTYLKKLQKLQDANISTTTGNGRCQEPELEEPSNGLELDQLSDTELRAKLLLLGHSAGPITAATRCVYLKKLARLQAALPAHHTANGHDQEWRPATRRRASPARQPAAAVRSPPPVALTDRLDWTAGYGRPTGISPLSVDQPMDEYDGTVQYSSPAAALPARVRYHPSSVFSPRSPPSPVYQPEPAVLVAAPLHQPEPAVSVAAPRPTPAPLYQPEAVSPQPVGRPPCRQSDTLYPRTPSTTSAYFSDRTALPASQTPSYRWVGLSQPAAGPALQQRDWAPAEPARPPPPPAATLRQRVADWCRPNPAPAATTHQPAVDYDTCSDSDGDGDGDEAELTPSEQLRAFRSRMNPVSRAAAGQEETDRGRYRSEGGSASHMVPWCILLLAVAFFGVLLLSYLSLGRQEETDEQQLAPPVDAAATVAVFPICGDSSDLPLGCVERQDMEPAVQLLADLQPRLVAAARDALCGRRDSPHVTISELVPLTAAQNSEAQLLDVATMVAYNPQLGLRADLSAAEPNLWAHEVATPWLCVAAGALRLVFKWIATITAVVVGGLAVRGAISWHQRRRQQQQQDLYQMVEHIMDVVKRHSVAAGADKPYVAMDHVRDQLLTPAERVDGQKMALWQRAVQFIRDKESRVREECVLVAGESHVVWRWLPSTAAAAAAAGTRSGRRVWLGQAFQTNNGVNTPVHTRTPCLKIRHMFDPACETGSGWIQEIRDALLEKCESVVVLHIAVDERNSEGLVYVKCRSENDALVAFKRIQGCWFDGRLVSVKFIRLERYHERYPDAVGSTQPLRPSNSLRRSLVDLERPELEDD